MHFASLCKADLDVNFPKPPQVLVASLHNTKFEFISNRPCRRTRRFSKSPLYSDIKQEKCLFLQPVRQTCAAQSLTWHKQRSFLFSCRGFLNLPETFKKGRRLLLFCCWFFFPQQAQRWSFLSALCRLRDWENWKWWSLPARMIKCEAKGTSKMTHSSQQAEL